MNNWYGLVAFLAGFVIAQLWKFVAGLMSERKPPGMTDFKTAIGYLTRSGGMPSGHAASMMAMTTFLGCYEGFNTGIFILAVAVTAIVIYDAIHVRYAVGEQGIALNKLLKKAEQKEVLVVEGHTFSQVLVGGILGILVGLVIFWLAT